METLSEGKCFPRRKTAGWRGLHHPGRPGIAFQQGAHAAPQWRRQEHSSSPQIVKPRFIRIETKAAGVPLGGLGCQPSGPCRGVCLLPVYVRFGGFGMNGGGGKRITEKREAEQLTDEEGTVKPSHQF